MLLSSKNTLTETSKIMFDHISEYHASARMTQIYCYSQIGKTKKKKKKKTWYSEGQILPFHEKN